MKITRKIIELAHLDALVYMCVCVYLYWDENLL